MASALADLVHGYGSALHMHSHGNINLILDRIVGTGVDMLNPLDPTEGMDLALVRERYPCLTLVGGMDKYIFDQEPEAIEAQLRRSVETCGRRGRFILMDTGGIPETVNQAQFQVFRAISRRVRGSRADAGKRDSLSALRQAGFDACDPSQIAGMRCRMPAGARRSGDGWECLRPGSGRGRASRVGRGTGASAPARIRPRGNSRRSLDVPLEMREVHEHPRIDRQQELGTFRIRPGRVDTSDFVAQQTRPDSVPVSSSIISAKPAPL